jgi:hypothetical protein
MKAVITEQQARQITGGRKPFEIVEYERAIKYLDACITLDDARYWKDYADRYAFWSKIHKDKEHLRKANKLDQVSLRKMAELAELLWPTKKKSIEACKISGCLNAVYSRGVCNTHYANAHRGGSASGVIDDSKGKGKPLGVSGRLRQTGLTANDAAHAVRFARIEKKKFDKLVDRGVSKRQLAALATKRRSSDAYVWLISDSSGPTLKSVNNILHRKSPVVAAELTTDEARKVRPIVISLIEWLDEFEQNLPRTGS